MEKFTQEEVNKKVIKHLEGFVKLAIQEGGFYKTIHEDIEDYIKQESLLGEEIKANNWYKSTYENSKFLMYITNVISSKKGRLVYTGYGFRYCGEWSNFKEERIVSPVGFEKAMPSEVKSRLDNELNKLGVIEGVKVLSLKNNEALITSYKSYFFNDEQSIVKGGVLVFSRGEFATIVKKEEKLKENKTFTFEVENHSEEEHPFIFGHTPFMYSHLEPRFPFSFNYSHMNFDLGGYRRKPIYIKNPPSYARFNFQREDKEDEVTLEDVEKLANKGQFKQHYEFRNHKLVKITLTDKEY